MLENPISPEQLVLRFNALLGGISDSTSTRYSADFDLSSLKAGTSASLSREGDGGFQLTVSRPDDSADIYVFNSSGQCVQRQNFTRDNIETPSVDAPDKILPHLVSENLRANPLNRVAKAMEDDPRFEAEAAMDEVTIRSLRECGKPEFSTITLADGSKVDLATLNQEEAEELLFNDTLKRRRGKD